MNHLTNPLFEKWWREHGVFRFGDVLKEFAAEVFQAGSECQLPDLIAELQEEAEEIESKIEKLIDGAREAIRLLSGEKK